MYMTASWTIRIPIEMKSRLLGSSRGPPRTDLEVIAVGKIVVQIRDLAEQSSAHGASVAIDHLLLHRVFDEITLVFVVTLRQELRRLLRSAVRAIHLAQLHRR